MTALNELRSQADEIDRLKAEAEAADIRIANDATVVAGLTAERDALARCKLADQDAYVAMRDQRDELRAALAERDAKLAELEKQEPVDAVAVEDMDAGTDWRYGRVLMATENCIKQLYAAAGAAPVPTEINWGPLKMWWASGNEQFEELAEIVEAMLAAAPKEPTP